MRDQPQNPVLPLFLESPVKPEVRTYTTFGGLYEAYEYTDWIEESMSWKETCYIGDWSPLPKLWFEGRDATRFLSSIAVNSLARFDIGQAKHLILCNSKGHLMGEGVLMRYGEEAFQFTSGPGATWAGFLFDRAKGKWNATLTMLNRFIFQVQGPNSLFVLEKLTDHGLRDIEFMRFRDVKVLGMDVTILRQGMGGDLGYELYGPSGRGAEMYDALLAAGEEFGIKRLGGRTKMVNHVEAHFPTPGVDYMPGFTDDDPLVKEHVGPRKEMIAVLHKVRGGSVDARDISVLFRNPVEMGWMNRIKFDHDFIGRNALEEVVRNPKRTMVSLVWNSDDVADVYMSLFRKGEPYQYMEMPRELLFEMVADRVVKNGRDVGMATSRCYSYYFREMISLCVLDVELCTPGTDVTVIWGDPGKLQKQIQAKVAPAPYKTDRRRIDVKTLPSYLK